MRDFSIRETGAVRAGPNGTEKDLQTRKDRCDTIDETRGWISWMNGGMDGLDGRLLHFVDGSFSSNIIDESSIYHAPTSSFDTSLIFVGGTQAFGTTTFTQDARIHRSCVSCKTFLSCVVCSGHELLEWVLAISRVVNY